jgi:hypothetical protein
MALDIIFGPFFTWCWLELDMLHIFLANPAIVRIIHQDTNYVVLMVSPYTFPKYHVKVII